MEAPRSYLDQTTPTNPPLHSQHDKNSALPISGVSWYSWRNVADQLFHGHADGRLYERSKRATRLGEDLYEQRA